MIGPTIDLTFPIRRETNVLIRGLPRDVTAKEIERLVVFLRTIPIPSDAYPSQDAGDKS